MSLGLRQAGFDILRAYDAWPVAVENYNRNIGNHAVVADLKDLLSTVPEILRLAPDMICGGPPCQDYSSAGNRTEADNARLTLAFAMIVSIIRPEWFMKINASRYGFPQSRRHLFVIGRIGERDDFLASSIASAASGKPMTIRDLFGATVPAAIFFPATSDARRSVWSSDEPAPTIRERSIRPIPTSYRPHPDDAAIIQNGYVYSRPVRAGRGVRSIDEPFPTVTRTAWERPTPRYLSAPAIEGRFLQWLVKRGRSKASARNVKASAGRARRLLGGRTFDNLALEIAAPETLPEFQAMRKATQSDLRQALRLLAEYQASRGQCRKKTRQIVTQPPQAFVEAA